MTANRIQQLLHLQTRHKQSVAELAEGLNSQFDLLIDIKLIEIDFQDSETIDLNEIQINIVETDSLYEELKEIDMHIEYLKNNLELLEQKLENL